MECVRPGQGIAGRAGRHDAGCDRGSRPAARGSGGRRRRAAGRGPARQGQAHGARAHRTPARFGLLRGIRHFRRTPLDRFRHGEIQDPRRRRGHGLGHRQWPCRGGVLQGLHGVRRLALRDPRRQDHQGPGSRHEDPGADHRHLRCRRCPHPGGRGGARRLRRGVPPQCRGLGRDPADLGHHGALRGRRRLFPGHDGLHRHGAGYELHVRDRP